MPHYLFALTSTVIADSEDEAREHLGMFLSAALVGEPGPVEDYSIDEVLEIYEDDGTIIILGDSND
jgi:hypothetical protein